MVEASAPTIDDLQWMAPPPPQASAPTIDDVQGSTISLGPPPAYFYEDASCKIDIGTGVHGEIQQRSLPTDRQGGTQRRQQRDNTPKRGTLCCWIIVVVAALLIMLFINYRMKYGNLSQSASNTSQARADFLKDQEQKSEEWNEKRLKLIEKMLEERKKTLEIETRRYHQ